MRYVIGLLVAFGLIILLIVLLASGGKKAAAPVRAKNLIDYASTDAQASLTIEGPINADSQHEQISITVDNNAVTYEHVQGYQGNVVDTKVFSNNEDAYDAFLHALQHAGFTEGSNDPSLRDGTGYCSTGDFYTFKLTQDGKTLESYWDTNCNGAKTYLGNTELTLTLFQAQVPDYTDLIENIQL